MLLTNESHYHSFLCHLLLVVVVAVEGTHEPVIFEECTTLALAVDIC